MGEFKDLFVHRDDVYAVQQSSGAYFPVTQAITDGLIQDHLNGLTTIGAYVVRPSDNTVSYIVFDLDTDDDNALNALIQAVETFTVVTAGGDVTALASILYEFSGKKGYHAWVFLSAPTPAAKVRAWVESHFMPAWNELKASNNWPLEVFPKQDTVEPGGYGNLVKLPLGKHRVSDRWSHFLFNDTVEGVRPFDVSLIPDVRIESRQRRTPRTETQRGNGEPEAPFACVTKIMHEGAGEGQRNEAMFHLSLYLFGQGIPKEHALGICRDANENFDPPLTDAEVQHTLASAYSGRYLGASCGRSWLRDFCPGPCRNGLNVSSFKEQPSLANVRPGQELTVIVVSNDFVRGARRIVVTHPGANNTPAFTVERSQA